MPTYIRYKIASNYNSLILIIPVIAIEQCYIIFLTPFTPIHWCLKTFTSSVACLIVTYKCVFKKFFLLVDLCPPVTACSGYVGSTDGRVIKSNSIIHFFIDDDNSQWSLILYFVCYRRS